MLITSANLTSAGINDNIELGVLMEAGPLPDRLSRHLELLIEAGTLQSRDRRTAGSASRRTTGGAARLGAHQSVPASY